MPKESLPHESIIYLSGVAPPREDNRDRGGSNEPTAVTIGSDGQCGVVLSI